ncbi:MAG: metallophosphoesterase family protein [Anaerolineae bacterium]|nr:metallophosphoesterase family protein [Anaerolineae bacterium]
MKLAILTDIHGCSIALDAVMQDIESRGGVDGYVFLGDYCAIGSDPAGVLERITKLSNARFVRGNTDCYSTSSNRPSPHLSDVLKNPTLATTYAEVSASFAWTQGMVTAAGWFDWLANLPLEERLTLPDGTKVLFVHATPGNDDGRGLAAVDDEEWVREAFVNSCEETLIFVGHVHIPHERRIDGKHLVNPGSVGNPAGKDIRAHYVILDADTSGYEVIRYDVKYDIEAVMGHIQAMHHPTAPYLLHFYRGEHEPEL